MFDFGGVVEAITAKLVRRHPHVFGAANARSSVAVKALWGRIKAEEKRDEIQVAREPRVARGGSVRRARRRPAGVAGADVRAMKLQEKAGKVGFDWNDVRAVLAKVGEEIAEVEAEIATGSAQSLSGEVGDLLFAVVNLARHLKVDPEAALRGANAKFERRFAHIENRLAERGRAPESASLDEMEVAVGRGEGQGAGGDGEDRQRLPRSRRNVIQSQRNEIQAERNKIKFGRNKNKISRTKTQTNFSAASSDFSTDLRQNHTCSAPNSSIDY